MSKSDEMTEGMSAEDYDRLADAFEGLAGSLKNVSEDLNKYQMRMRWATALAGIALTVILTVMLGMYFISRSSNDVVEAIRDCTEPGGQCYEKANHRTDERLSPFVRLICDATPPERRGPLCPK